MAYATRTDLAQYMPAGPLAKVSTAQQDRALNDSSASADSALGNQYDLPLIAPYPPDLIEMVCKRASANLMGLVGYNTENGANQWVVDYRKDADTYFGMVARGERTPQGIVDSTPAVRTGGPLVMSNPRRGW